MSIRAEGSKRQISYYPSQVPVGNDADSFAGVSFLSICIDPVDR